MIVLFPSGRFAGEELLASADAVGVWLAGSDDPAALADDLHALALVAMDFPKFTDGRGYSIAVALRNRFGYTGPLRAIGQVLRDQFNSICRAAVSIRWPRRRPL